MPQNVNESSNENTVVLRQILYKEVSSYLYDM